MSTRDKQMIKRREESVCNIRDFSQVLDSVIKPILSTVR